MTEATRARRSIRRLARMPLPACLALAGVLLLASATTASEDEPVAIHMIPGQYVRMIVGPEAVEEVRLMAIVRNHTRKAFQVVSSRCEAFGPESEAQLAKASELGGHLCQLDPAPPWDLHPSKQRRIGVTWPVPTPRPPEGKRRVAPGAPHDMQFVGLRIWRSKVHAVPQDRVHLVLTLADGRQVVGEGFHLAPFDHMPRRTRNYLGITPR